LGNVKYTAFPERIFRTGLQKPLEFFHLANIVMASGLAGIRAGQKACLAHRPMRQRATGPALLPKDVFTNATQGEAPHEWNLEPLRRPV
jgi:hypothetical protein